MNKSEFYLYNKLLVDGNYFESESVGLYGGAIGKAIVLFLISKRANNYLYSIHAIKQLNLVANNLFSFPEFNFSDGLIGVSWGLEFIVQNGLYKDINTDEVLEDIDDEMYKRALYIKDSDISLSHGTLGSLLYFVKRLSSKNKTSKRYRVICNQECLAYLIDEVASYIYSFELKADIIRLCIHPDDLQSKRQKNIKILGDVLFILSYVINYEPRANEIIDATCNYAELLFVNWLEVSYEKFLKLSESEVYDCLYLAINLIKIGKQQYNDTWIKHGEKFMNFVLEQDGDNQIQKKSEFLLKKLTIFCLINSFLPQRKIEDKIISIIAEIEKHNLPFSMFQGLGIVICAKLSILDSNLIDNWNELFSILI